MPDRNRLGQFAPGHKLSDRGPRRPNSGQFKPGHTGIGTKRKQAGDTYLNRKSGEVFVCVDRAHPYFPHRPHHFKPRRLVNFETAHGPAPPDCVVIRILADPLDDRLGNLVLIRRAALLALNSGRWSPDRTPFASLPHDRRLRLDAIAVAVLRAGPPAIFLPGA